MSVIDWTWLGLGGAAGLGMGAVFFVGLAVGMRLALRRANAVALLSLSAALRIALFLGAGWLVVVQAGPWAFVGYGIGFVLARILATTLARAGLPAGGAP
jgi:hypothetical protein